ncbi:hypothetical protein HGA13_20495 [Nocardia speluncae]|uniref:Uncharacterized protein n=1 Tax=Nocardia speluncae TaxID=419477 RepID=A0A846XLD3_9NOCA|nr:hypothetical protein [Nocardia speluncae]NKY35430.1 hypothetical protein [Nocardia speluncae]
MTVVYKIDGPKDPFNNPTKIDVTVPDVPAEVFSLDSDVSISSDLASVINRYRLIIHPMADIPAKNAVNELRFSWGPYQVTGNYSGLIADGAVERHVIRGRLHHYEVICKSVVG